MTIHERRVACPRAWCEWSMTIAGTNRKEIDARATAALIQHVREHGSLSGHTTTQHIQEIDRVPRHKDHDTRACGPWCQ
jgi:hypothetical protein